MEQRKIEKIHHSLSLWYMANQRKLPWRKTKDPYHIWVSEVMLQQTQVKTVLSYYSRFLNTFPDIKTLAKADLNEVLKMWEGMGYYARARNLHKAADKVLNTYKGLIPGKFKPFKSLPGVGEYIASAVMSIAFNLPFAVVDGNVKRVLSRLLLIDVPINHTSSLKIFQSAANTLLDQKSPGTFNQAVMELGALICTPSSPSCEHCPLKKLCSAFHDDKVTAYPKRLQRKKIPEYRIATGVVLKGDHLLITRRSENGLLGGLWEFPGGKIKKNESPMEAVIREIYEEVHLDIEVITHLSRIRHAYTHFKIIMEVFICRYVSGKVRLDGPVDHCWLRPGELQLYPFPGANRKFISKLLNWLDANPAGRLR